MCIRGGGKPEAGGQCDRRSVGRHSARAFRTYNHDHRAREDPEVEPQRLVQEAAILADRSDVTEEIHRLAIHSRDLTDLLNKGSEIGKKLDFLMQEMGRETNTVLSKTSGAGDLGLRITDLGIAVKAEIERIREQSLNLE